MDVQGTSMEEVKAYLASQGLGDTFGLGSGFAVPFNGYRQRVVRKAGGLGTLLVNGLGIGLNSWSDHEWDGGAWQQTASGGLI